MKLYIAMVSFGFAITLTTSPSLIAANDIVTEAEKAGLKEFVAAITVADLAEEAKTTNPPAPFTVFAPNDAAFKKAGLKKERAVLRPIIKYHVVPGKKTP